MKRCFKCERTLRGFIYQAWGALAAPLFAIAPASWMIGTCEPYTTCEKIGLYVLRWRGYARNPYWPSMAEREWCKKNDHK